jgi:hypothetical protein
LNSSRCAIDKLDPCLCSDPKLIRSNIDQNIAVRLIRDALVELGDGVPSTALINAVMDMGVGSGRLIDPLPYEGLPESKLQRLFNQHLYNRFETPPSHFDAMFELVRRYSGIDALPPDTGNPVALADVWIAQIVLRQPIFPLRASLELTRKGLRYHFDAVASSLRLELGTGFKILGKGPEFETMRDLISRCCDITAAADQLERRTTATSADQEVALQSLCIEHGLLSLPPKAPENTMTVNLDDFVYEIIRLTTLIYSALVFFPCGQAAQVPQRVAAMLKVCLSQCPEINSDAGRHSIGGLANTCDAENSDLLLWSITIGAVASLGSPMRAWYIVQLSVPIEHRRLSLADLKPVLRRYLYWDFVFGKAVADVYNEAVELHL